MLMILAEQTMVASSRTHTLTDFNQRAAETLDRLGRTGEAEFLTLDGETRAVLLSPQAFADLARDAQLTRDAAVMRQAAAQIQAGDFKEADAFFGELRAKLNAMKNSSGSAGE